LRSLPWMTASFFKPTFHGADSMAGRGVSVGV
jgi:hypothetical protein